MFKGLCISRLSHTSCECRALPHTGCREVFRRVSRSRAGLSILGVDVFLAVVKVIDFADGEITAAVPQAPTSSKVSSSSTGDVTAFNSHAEVFSKLSEALVCD